MAPIRCPDDHELLRLATGEAPPEGVRHHVDGCPACQERVGQLRGEVSALRQVGHGLGSETEPALGPPPTPEVTEAWVAPSRAGSAAFTPADGVPGPVPQSPRPAYIGKYLVVGELDAGGHGSVYRAVHPMLGKDVVIKLAHAPLDGGGGARDLLVAEGKLLAELDHPALVRVYDLDVHDGRPFLAMEYVRGCTLQQHAEREHPTPRQAAALVAVLARAAAVAHRHGVVHRDIKPKNVLVDEAGRPRLIDFGMALLRHAWSGDGEGSSGGTLAYMAPEQARKEADRVGPRSDVFALGAVLYFLLTGKAPFAGKTRAEAWGRSGRCDFDRGALRTAGAPRALERLCLRAMAAEPDDRPVTADVWAADLERFVSRPRRLAILGSVAAVALVAVGAWSLLPRRSADPNSARMHVNSFAVQLYRGDPAKFEGTIGQLSFSGRSDDNVRVSARLSVPAYCYLLALNPDGSVQFCPKAQENTPPSATTEIAYPTGDDYYGLTDGTGLQAFVLIASRKPLPAFSSWRHRAALPWKPTTKAAEAWRFDGRYFKPLTDETRGERRVASAAPATLTAVCESLRRLPGVDDVEAVAFPVEPTKAGPAGP